MKILALQNPFSAPVYHEETVSSTFDIARDLAAKGEAHGTVICADFQESGRGRLNRSWKSDRGKNLLFTVLLRCEAFSRNDFSSIPEALTLRTGLAVSLAVEDLVPSLAGFVKVKWPNDVMIGSGKAQAARKAAGILTEFDGKNVFIGIGVNVAQTGFPAEYRSRAGSIIHSCPELGEGGIENIRFVLLEKILARLYEEIETPNKSGPWRERLVERLYKKGETVVFAPGAADSEQLVEGTLSGIGPKGELLIIPKGEKDERAFVNGELRVYL